MRCHTDIERVLALSCLDAGASQNLDIAVVIAHHILALRIHRCVNVEVLQRQICIVLDAHRSAGHLQRTVLQGDRSTLFEMHRLALVAGAADGFPVHCIGVAAKVEGQGLGVLGFELDTASFRVLQQGDGVAVLGCCNGFRQGGKALRSNRSNGIGFVQNPVGSVFALAENEAV